LKAQGIGVDKLVGYASLQSALIASTLFRQKEIVVYKMKSLRFFLVLLLVWLGTQIVIWGWSEFILKGSQLERMLELEDVEPYLKIPFYLLWPLTVAVPITRRIVKKDNT